MSLPGVFLKKLNKRKQEGLLRVLPDNTDVIDFASNDYLGIAYDQRKRGVRMMDLGSDQQMASVGSTGSRLISGNQPYIAQFESDFTDHMGFEQALVYASGYSANVGLLSSLSERGVIFLMDELCHASLIDGARLGFAKRYTFKHNHLDDLEQQLKRLQGTVIVVVESIYSMDGDFADLTQILALCQKYRASLIVDEAHALGVDGPQGKGRVVAEGMQEKVLAAIYPFGKAPASHGALVAGSLSLRQYLINYSRAFVYSTAPSSGFIQDMSTAFDRLLKNDSARQDLRENIEYYQHIASKLLLTTQTNKSPIQYILVGHVEKAKQLQQILNDAGFGVKAILSPTVAEGSERLRISLHAFNSKKQIRRLLEMVQQCLRC